MEQIASALPQFAELIQKAGIVGVLLIACGVLWHERLRLRKENAALYKERDAYRLYYVVHKQACDSHVPPIRVDTSSLAPLPGLLPAPL